jgi:hypothetical protein
MHRQAQCAALRCWLIDFHNPRGFDDWGFLLTLSKFLRAITVDVDAGELFAVGIIHGDLPVVVFPPAVTLHAVCFFRRFLFQVKRPLG